MYAKPSKCVFAIPKIEYLGHFIYVMGLETDSKEIEAVAKWPIHKTIKELRSFLGLSGYYRKFIRGYALVRKPLTNLPKKEAFEWNRPANEAFQSLKSALVSAPVLDIPNFSIPFVVETDASKEGIGAVVMQDHHPIAFISRSVGPRWKSLSIYEKKFLALVFAVQKWEQYLMGVHFVIRTNQKSLKWLLKQKISTRPMF